MTSVSILHISFEDLCQSASINEELMLELVEYSIVEPISGALQHEWQFNVAAVNMAKKALRLQHDLAIDWADVALVLDLLAENETLRDENARLKQRLGRFEKANGDG